MRAAFAPAATVRLRSSHLRHQSGILLVAQLKHEIRREALQVALHLLIETARLDPVEDGLILVEQALLTATMTTAWELGTTDRGGSLARRCEAPWALCLSCPRSMKASSSCSPWRLSVTSSFSVASRRRRRRLSPFFLARRRSAITNSYRSPNGRTIFLVALTNRSFRLFGAPQRGSGAGGRRRHPGGCFVMTADAC